MPGLIRMSLNYPEEVRPFQGGIGPARISQSRRRSSSRVSFQPGWRWSEHVKPIAKTDSCQAAHTGYFVSGRMKVVMEDGEEMEYGPGDFAVMAPGHDAGSSVKSRASSSTGKASLTMPNRVRPEA